MNQYLNSVMATVKAKNRGEDEFLQAVEEVLETLSTFHILVNPCISFHFSEIQLIPFAYLCISLQICTA